jgi:site-specific DNA recombinase
MAYMATTRTCRRARATTTVIGYARVSTFDQATEGVSLEAQRRLIEAHCEAHGLTLLRVEEDRGISAKKTAGRPGLARAREALRRGDANALVATKLDRVTRSIRDAIALIEQAEREGWRLVSLGEALDTATPMGRFFVHMLGALAELERAQIGERTKAALAELKRQGRRVSGKPPLGYRFEAGRLVAVPGEQAVARRIVALAEMGWGAKRMAAALNGEGIVNPRTGKAWFHGTLRDVALGLATRARA